MSGDNQNHDSDDFLDDFVFEEGDGAEKGTGSQPTASDDAAAEFSAPPSQPEPPPGAAAAAADDDDADADANANANDVLFTDHTQGVEASEEFDSGATFDEAAESTWDGEELELDSFGEAGVPVEGEDVGEDLDFELVIDEAVAESEAEDFFGEDSPLLSEDEFGLDSELELEIVGDASVEPVDLDEADTFVIDDGEMWTQDVEEEPTLELDPAAAALLQPTPLQDGFEEVELGKPVDDDEDSASVEFLGNLSGAAAGGELAEEGWEPLPGTNMDQLAEVDDIDHLDGETDAAAADSGGWARRALVGAAVDEGHDIYAEAEDEPEVVGAVAPRGRMFSMIAALAATLLVVGGAMLAVWRPEWFGLRVEPQQVEIVQLQRPQVRVPVGAPPMPIAAAPRVETPEQPKVVVNEPPVVTPVPVQVPVEGDPEAPVATGPVANGEGPAVVPVPEPQAGNGEMKWPVTTTQGAGETAVAAAAPELLRVGNDLLVGDAQGMPNRGAADGVVPGTRAFAQLYNGNYFIGRVKAVDSEFLTLRMNDGEISLPRQSIVKVTELGTADYDTLKKATSGFIRLTNNNRLVGGILHSIADDHVVLETRSNRVMLPRSVIGEIVTGDDNAVRLGTTAEEDAWLRKLSERQLQGSDPRATQAAPTGSGRGQ